MTDQSRSGLISSLQVLSLVASVVVTITGSVVLIGWIFDVEIFKAGSLGTAAMRANTALSFILAGVSLWTLGTGHLGQSRRVGAACSGIVTLVALLTVSEYVFGWNLGIDQVLFQAARGTVGPTYPGRMAQTSAANLLMLGLALQLLHARRGLQAAQWLTLVASLVSLLALIGYVYGVKSLYGRTLDMEMGLRTAGTFLVLCIGLLLARPDQGLMATLTSESTGGVMARRLLPAALAIPAVLGWVRLLGERSGLYEKEFGVSLSVVSSIVLLTALIWWSAGSQNRIDAKRREAEEEVRASEEQFRAVARTANDAIISADSRGNITYFNSRAEQMFGFPANGIIGKPLTLLMPERFHDPHRGGMERFLSTGEAHVIGKTVELAGRRMDGSEFPVELSLANWRTGQGVFFTAIIRDITRRKRSEEEIKTLNEDLKRHTIELEAVNKELQTFAYSVSHDLRAPLRAINCFSQALVEDCADTLNARSKDDLERVRAASQRMEQLINDLLALSKVTRSEMRRSKVDISALAASLLAELQEEQPERQVEVCITPKLVVHADANLLRIAVGNLLGNAWKFTGKRAQATIELGVTQHNGQSAYFVRDNGAGFDMAFAGRLFGAFQRLHGMTEFEGTGIGLATVQRIIHRHGGRVWAEGELEKGASFYFTLPG